MSIIINFWIHNDCWPPRCKDFAFHYSISEFHDGPQIASSSSMSIIINSQPLKPHSPLKSADKPLIYTTPHILAILSPKPVYPALAASLALKIAQLPRNPARHSQKRTRCPIKTYYKWRVFVDPLHLTNVLNHLSKLKSSAFVSPNCRPITQSLK